MTCLNVKDDMVTVYNGSINAAFTYDTLKKEVFYHKLDGKTSKKDGVNLLKHCACFSNTGKWYTVAEDRKLFIYETYTRSLKYTKLLKRTASKIIFSSSDEFVIVADKTGNVYRYPVDEDYKNGQLLLGHFSILLDVLITPDERYIITCDRDEKIRVSCYPNSYNIVSYCLGHRSFVSKMLLLGNMLLSSSGDGTIRGWKYETGEQLLVQKVEMEGESVIVNMDAFERGNYIVCVSVLNYAGILVYEFDVRMMTIKWIQKIDCREPFDFTLMGNSLWILNYSEKSTVGVLYWNSEEMKFERNDHNKNDKFVDAVNELTELRQCSRTDYSLLSKKCDFEEHDKSVSNHTTT